MRSRSLARLLPALAASLWACDWSLPWAAKSGPPFPVAVSPAAISFQASVGDPAPSREIFVSGFPAGVELRAEASGPIDAVQRVASGQGMARFAVTAALPAALGVGTYSGEIRLRAHAVGYRVPDPGWEPWTVPVAYEVRGSVIDVTPTAVTLVYLLGGPTVPEAQIQLSGPPGAGPWTVEAPSWIEVSPASGTATPATVTLRSSYTQSTSGDVTVIRGQSRRSVHVDLTARRPVLRATPDHVDFQVMQGQLPPLPATTIAVSTEQDVPVPLSCGVDVTGLLVSPYSVVAPGSVDLGVYTTDYLTPGSKAGKMSCWDTFDVFSYNRIDVPVTVQVVVPLAITPPGLAFRITPATTPADLQAQVLLTAPSGPVSWTVSADVTWLDVSPASGTAGGASTLAVSVLPAALPDLQSFRYPGPVTYPAMFRLSYVLPDGTRGALTIYVDLVVDLPFLRLVGPRYDVEGNAREVVVLGENLLATTGVRFGSEAAPSFRVVTSAELRVTPPQLPAGSYPVTLPTALGVVRGTGPYRVESAVSAGPGVIRAPGRKTKLFLDEGSGFLWAVSPGAGAIERYRASASWSREALPIPGLQDATFTTDGTQLLAVAGTALLLVDAASLTLSAQQPSAVLPAEESALDHRVSMALDGMAPIIRSSPGSGACFLYDARAMQLQYGCPYQLLRANEAAEARSGRRVGFASDADSTAVVWEAAFGGLWSRAVSGIAATTSAALDRHGDAMLLLRDGTASPGYSIVLDALLQPRPGRLPDTVAAAVLTQDGARAIAFDGASRTVRRFDLAAAPDLATGLFPELIPSGGFAPPGDPGSNAVLALSADDRVLFLGGDEAIAVVPLP